MFSADKIKIKQKHTACTFKKVPLHAQTECFTEHVWMKQKILGAHGSRLWRWKLVCGDYPSGISTRVKMQQALPLSSGLQYHEAQAMAASALTAHLLQGPSLYFSLFSQRQSKTFLVLLIKHNCRLFWGRAPLSSWRSCEELPPLYICCYSANNRLIKKTIPFMLKFHSRHCWISLSQTFDTRRCT